MHKYNLIFLRQDIMLLSDKKYTDWKGIQEEYPDYSASLNFSNRDELKEYIVLDYKLNELLVEDFLHEYAKSHVEAVEINISTLQ